MPFQNLKFLIICLLSAMFLFACGTEFEEGDIDLETNTRTVIDATPVVTEGCRPNVNPVTGNTYHEQNLDLTGKDLKRGKRTVEKFLTDLGFDISDLCTGNCDDGKDCTVTNFFNSINSDLKGTHPAGDNNIISKVAPRSWNQDMSDVDMKIRAVCNCKD